MRHARLAIVVITLLAGCRQAAIPSAVSGVLDLRASDLRGAPRSLIGDWELYWNRSADGAPDLYVPPAKWRGTRLNDGRELPASGVATYRIKVLLPEAAKNGTAWLALATDPADTAYRLSATTVAGDVLFTPVSSGVVGDRELHRPAYRRLDASFVSHDDLFVTLEVSNFDTRSGGPWLVPRLGFADEIAGELRRQRDLDYLLFGILFIMAMHHLGIFLLRRRERGPLWLFLFTLLVAIRTMITGRYVDERQAEQWWSLLIRAEYLTFYVAVPLFGLFVRAMFPAHFSRRFIHGVAVLSSPFVAAVLLTPPAFFTETLVSFQVITMAYLVWMLVHMVRATLRERDVMGLLFLLGFLVVAVTVINDILRTLEVVQTPYVVAYGLTAFLVFQSLLVAIMNQRARRQAEAYGQEMTTLNDELQRQIGDRSHRLSEMLATIAFDQRRSLELAPGAVIAERYRIERLLGEGGMGAVYAAVRLNDGREIALKVIRMSTSAHLLARFAREAEAAATVNHPNVVSILDIDVSAHGELFIVMERIRGTSLDAESKHFGDPAWALPILEQLARALAAIHRAGIVHRDLKPGNILLDETGVLKVADFGIAAVGRPDLPASDSSGSETRNERRPVTAATAELTETGMVLGSPFYMAPEASLGAQHVTSRADMFSFGLIAYEILSGLRPFERPFDRLKDQRPPPSLGQRCPGLAPRLVALVDRCLAVDPAGRPNADELIEALDPYKRVQSSVG